MAGTSKLWREFVDATAAGREPILPDFSYAGYRYSDQPIPDVKGPIFNVTKYGAKPNDDGFDDAAIQAAIDAAKAAGGGVVLFPSGQFRVNPTEDAKHFITINAGNIVLRGAGSGAGGTEVLMVARKQGGAMFRIGPSSWSATTVANITANATRETFRITVDNASQLRTGQRVVIRYQSLEYNDFYYGGLALDPDWERVVKNGVGIHEAHVIAEIAGNRVRFREPLHFTLRMGGTPHRLEAVTPLVEVGIEDLRFTGSWDAYPETFVHHKDWIHDTAWTLLSIRQVANGWVRDAGQGLRRQRGHASWAGRGLHRGRDGLPAAQDAARPRIGQPRRRAARDAVRSGHRRGLLRKRWADSELPASRAVHDLLELRAPRAKRSHLRFLGQREPELAHLRAADLRGLHGEYGRHVPERKHGGRAQRVLRGARDSRFTV